MKVITNDSFQGLEIYFNTTKGPKSYWLSPKESIVVPSSYISKIIQTLQRRRMVKVYNYHD